MRHLRRRDEPKLVRFTPTFRVLDRSEEWLQAGTMLRRLRALAPARPLTVVEALSVAERQAFRLLAVVGADAAPIPLEVITGLSRIGVAFVANIPVAGATVWGGGAWRITVEADLPSAEQRMVIAHEFKHIVDYTVGHDRYGDPGAREPVADFFARCLFMPRPVLKSLVSSVGVDVSRVADLFGVPRLVAQCRLVELGLLDDVRRGRGQRAVSRDCMEL